MKSTVALSALALFSTALAAPAPIDYTPPGGWESIKYPKGTGENLPYYPPPPGGWENVKYPAGTGQGGDCKAPNRGPFTFTSYFHVVATPDQVVNGTTPTGGLAGAKGFYDFAINSETNLICYKIVLNGFRGNYSSPARTATHIHNAKRGASGPPRIAFPNPVGNEQEAISVGCLYGPFKTGVMANGADSGDGFTLKQLEQNPADYFADVHSSLAVPGAVRGQLA